MYIVISIFILILCVLLGLIILVQNPKGGGLTQSLGGVSSQVFGAKNSSGLVEKVTWYLAIAIVVLTMSSVVFIPSSSATEEVVKTEAEILNESREVSAPIQNAQPLMPPTENTPAEQE